MMVGKARMLGFGSGRLFVGPRDFWQGNKDETHIEFLITGENGSMRESISLEDWNELVEFIQEQVING